MSLNGDMLSVILKILGVRNLTIATDHPEAVITIAYTRHDDPHQAVYTLQDLIDATQAQPKPGRPGAPDGYTDINDIPTPETSSG